MVPRMKLTLNDLTPETFLAEYWQKKPFVIRQGFKDFKDFLSADELAGLATDELVESRRVFKKEGEWQAEFGPFESYEHLGENDWTLIVQALNNWVPDVERLLACFDFLPRWRLDDVMVSYGRPGGSVGPHIDLYDVFICQGSGSRRWRVGDIGPHKEFIAHPALLHVEPFESIIDVELKTGDILYLPPGFPHNGVSLEPSMSFSVGYRTASAKDMHSALSDYLIDNELAPQQIEDPDRKLSQHSGKINNSDFDRIKQHLINVLDNKTIAQFAGGFLTHSKCDLDLPEEVLGFENNDFLQTLKTQPLIRLGGLRALYFESSNAEGTFYINGEEINLPKELAPLIPLLCDQQELSSEVLAPWLDNATAVEYLVEWLNRGYWYFDD